MHRKMTHRNQFTEFKGGTGARKTKTLLTLKQFNGKEV